MTPRALIHAAIAAAGLLLAAEAQAQGSLVLYCAVQEEWCRAATTAFERETGIKVSMTRKSSGEVYAQIKAEAANPRGDIWWGGTGDPHLQAAEEGLTDDYKSPKLAELQRLGACGSGSSRRAAPSASTRARSASATTPKLIASKKLAEPKCWADLLEAEVQGRDPGRQPELVGHRLHAARHARAADGRGQGASTTSRRCTRTSTSTPSRARRRRRRRRSARRRSASPSMHDVVTMAVDGAPVKIVAPCEGTGYEIGSMCIIKGARNLENAKKWYDWALTPGRAGDRRGKPSQYQVPSNKTTPVPPQAPKLGEIKLIDYDFAKYGSSDERTPPALEVGRRDQGRAEIGPRWQVGVSPPPRGEGRLGRRPSGVGGAGQRSDEPVRLYRPLQEAECRRCFVTIRRTRRLHGRGRGRARCGSA